MPARSFEAEVSESNLASRSAETSGKELCATASTWW